MYEHLQQYFSKRTSIDKITFEEIARHFYAMETKRNEILLRPGEVCKHYYFVNQGCLRLFALNNEGVEGTRYFAFEGSFGTALPSLIDQKPAFEYIQTIEKSTLLVINRNDFFTLVDTVPAFASIYRQILELSFIHAQKRIYGFQGMEAIDKLKMLLQAQPLILSRVSNKMVASYLGVSPATLSRLKNQLRK